MEFTHGYIDLNRVSASAGPMLFCDAEFSEGCVAFGGSKLHDFVLDFKGASFRRDDGSSGVGPFRQRWLAPIEDIVEPGGKYYESPGEDRSSNTGGRQLKNMSFRELNYPLPSLDFTDAVLRNVRLEFEYVNWFSGGGSGVVDLKGASFDGADLCFAHADVNSIVIVLWNAYLAGEGRLRFDKFAHPVILTDYYSMIENQLTIVLTDPYKEGHEGVVQEMRSLEELTPWVFGINSMD
jgi:hypothetical protein